MTTHEKAPFERATNLNLTNKLTTGCASIDKLLNGGLHVGGIVEIFGESSSGKTQLCLQLCITCQREEELGGLAAGAAFINTEAPFPKTRLEQMLDKLKDKDLIRNNIFISTLIAKDCGYVMNFLKIELIKLLRECNVKLIVIDSIAAIFRGSEATGSQRAENLRNLGALLHQISRTFSVCIVVVNQVTQQLSANLSSPGTLIPALGIAWSNEVTTRIQLSRTADSSLRKCSIVFSALLPPGEALFSITTNGLCSVDC